MKKKKNKNGLPQISDRLSVSGRLKHAIDASEFAKRYGLGDEQIVALLECCVMFIDDDIQKIDVQIPIYLMNGRTIFSPLDYRPEMVLHLLIRDAEVMRTLNYNQRRERNVVEITSNIEKLLTTFSSMRSTDGKGVDLSGGPGVFGMMGLLGPLTTVKDAISVPFRLEVVGATIAPNQTFVTETDSERFLDEVLNLHLDYYSSTLTLIDKSFITHPRVLSLLNKREIQDIFSPKRDSAHRLNGRSDGQTPIEYGDFDDTWDVFKGH